MSKGRKIILAEDNLADVELTKIAFSEIDIPLEVVHVFDGQALMDYLNEEAIARYCTDIAGFEYATYGRN